MSNTVLLFTLNGCGHCVSLKKRLNELSIPFTEVEVNQNQELWDQVVAQTKIDYLPTFFIKQEGSDSGPVFCPERDFNDEDEAVEIIKHFVLQ
jgi:glutaredoxin